MYTDKLIIFRNAAHSIRKEHTLHRYCMSMSHESIIYYKYHKQSFKAMVSIDQ